MCSLQQMKKVWILMLMVLAMLGMVTSTSGQGLDSPAAPKDPASAMYTLEDLYNRLDTGVAGAKRTGAFVEPTEGPINGPMHTFNEIMSKAPATNASAATDAEVLSA